MAVFSWTLDKMWETSPLAKERSDMLKDLMSYFKSIFFNFINRSCSISSSFLALESETQDKHLKSVHI